VASADARAFWVVAPGRGVIRAESLPKAAAGEVLVSALYSGISRGTEALVFSGRVPASETARMRAPFQSGEFPGPVKYGYSNVGTVIDGPPHLLNRVVFSLFPHQTRYIVPAAAVFALPEGVPPARAVLAANLETAVNGIWDARPHIGDRIVVIGAGTVGCLVAWLAGRIVGCDVELVDINPKRAAIAAALGVSFRLAESVSAGADLVSTIVDMSWYGDQSVALPLGEAFHAQRLTLRSSQVGHVAVSQRARWDTRRRMEFVLGLLREPALDVLFTGETDFDQLPEAMAKLAASPDGALCHRVRY